MRCRNERPSTPVFHSMSPRLFLVTALLAACTTNARAQLAPPSNSPDTAHTYGQVISVSPVFALLGFYTGEVERRVTSNATIGVGGSAFSLGPLGYKSVDGKIRFYPGERALEGLSVGASAVGSGSRRTRVGYSPVRLRARASWSERTRATRGSVASAAISRCRWAAGSSAFFATTGTTCRACI